MNARSLNSILSWTVIAMFGAALVACGGGSSSSGGAGGSGSPRSANLVVQVNGNGTAFLDTGPGIENRMVAMISDFLVREAMATEPEGHQVCIYDSSGALVDCAVTNQDGVAFFTVEPDEVSGYTACFEEAVPGDGGCVGPVTVASGEIVTATVECDDAQTCSLMSAEAVLNDDPENFVDPRNDNKFIICHRPDSNNPRTLTIAQDAWPDHEAHGDVPGACPNPGPGSSGVDSRNDDPGGNNPNNQEEEEEEEE